MRQHRIISLDICSYIPLAEVNVGLLADNVGIAATNTLDLRQGVLNLALAINVRVEQTVKVLVHIQCTNAHYDTYRRM